MSSAALVALAAALSTAVAGRADPTADTDGASALAALDRRMASLDAEAQSRQDELGRLSGEMSACRSRLVARGRLYYRLTRAGLLPVGAGFGAFVTYAIRVERVRRMLVTGLADESRLRAREADVTAALARLSRDRAALNAQHTAMEQARDAALDEVRRDAAFDKAFQSSTGPAPGFAPVGAPSVPVDAPAGGFATARGRLLFPVAKQADVTPARREGSEGGGVEIHVPAGTPVRAVFAGRVAFADRYGPYGRIVIVDHGDHYYTVSGNLDAIEVKIGQDVAAGDPLGTVGDEGNGPMLYFEVRHGSRTVPAKEWLGM